MFETYKQEAEFPTTLSDLVSSLSYKKGWSFDLYPNYDRGQGSKGTTLIITVSTVNSYPPHENMRVNHLMIVPPAAYDERSWRRWLLDQILLVEQHEACEFFVINGEHPYAPSHGPGNDPYLIREIGTELDQKTSFRGEVLNYNP